MKTVPVCFLVKAQVAFGMELDLFKYTSHFPKAIETCLKGMVHYVRDVMFEVIVQTVLIEFLAIENKLLTMEWVVTWVCTCSTNPRTENLWMRWGKPVAYFAQPELSWSKREKSPCKTERTFQRTSSRRSSRLHQQVVMKQQIIWTVLSSKLTGQADFCSSLFTHYGSLTLLLLLNNLKHISVCANSDSVQDKVVNLLTLIFSLLQRTWLKKMRSSCWTIS